MEQTPRESRGDRGSENNWWRRLVEAAAVIAVPPAVFYVAGLLAFWVQLSNEYQHFGNEHAWIAASLIARATAASLGAEIFLRGLVVASALATVVLLAAYIILKLKPGQRDDSDSQTPVETSWLTPVMPAWVIPGLTFIVGAASFFIVFTQDRAPLVFTVKFSGALAVAYLLNFYHYWNLGGAARAAATRAITFYPKGLYNLIVVLGMVCLGGSVLFPGEASLPCLYRETTQGDVINGDVLSAQQAAKLEGYKSLEGGFLGRSEGYWYVFDEEHLKLEAIPDDGARRILDGEFYIAYTRLGPDGKPVGEQMTEEETQEDNKPGQGYEPSGGCDPPTQ